MWVRLLAPVGGLGERVTFETSDGSAAGSWMGEAEQDAHVPVDVECTVLDGVDWSGVELDPIRGPAWSMRGARPVVRGRVEAQGDGLLVLRAADGLVALAVDGLPPFPVVGRTVQVAVLAIELYPTGV